MAAQTNFQKFDNVVPVHMMKNKMTAEEDAAYLVVKVEKDSDEMNGFEPDVVDVVTSAKSSKLNDKDPNVTVYRVPKKFPVELKQDKHSLIKSEKVKNDSVASIGVTIKKPKLRGTDNMKKCAPGVSLLKHFIKLHKEEQVQIKDEREVTDVSKGVKLEDTDDIDNVTEPTQVTAMTKNYHCDSCDRVYMYSESLRKHINQVHLDIKPYACDICGLRFPAPWRLQAHKKTHTQTQTVACDICSKEIRKCGLKLHMDSHMGNKDTSKSPSESRRRSCAICDKVFSKPYVLKRHMYLHTGEPKPHKCSLCDAAFNTETDLKHHILLHSDLKEFICEFCGKGFPSVFHLRKHRYIHTKEKTFVCETCGKKFSHRSRLLDHEANHSNAKPHICNICNKGFPRAKNLKRHMILHEGKKEHVCSVCGKEFALKDSLTDHQKTHSGEATCCCDLCGKLFQGSRNLKRHRLIHTDELPHECSICGKRCRYLTNLHKHMRVHDEKNKTAKSHRNLNLLKYDQKKVTTKPVRSLNSISLKDLTSDLENGNKQTQTAILEENLKQEATEAVNQSSIPELEATKFNNLGNSGDDQPMCLSFRNQAVNVQSDDPLSKISFNKSLNNDEFGDHEDNDETGDDVDDLADDNCSSCSDNNADSGAHTRTEIWQTGNIAKQVTEDGSKLSHSQVQFKPVNDKTGAATKVFDKSPINAAHSRIQESIQKTDYKTEFQQFLSSDRCVDQFDTNDKMSSRLGDETDRMAKLEKRTGTSSEVIETVKSDRLTDTTSKQKQWVRLLKIGGMFPCRLCSVKFKLYDTLVMHMVHVHDIEEDHIIDEEGFYS